MRERESANNDNDIHPPIAQITQIRDNNNSNGRTTTKDTKITKNNDNIISHG